MTYGLGFGFVPGFTPTPLPLALCQYQPHERHMQTESRSYSKVNTAAAAAFYTYPDANVFLLLLQFLPLRQLGERRRFALHIHARTETLNSTVALRELFSPYPLNLTRSRATCTGSLTLTPRPTSQLLLHFTPMPTPMSFSVYFLLRLRH